MSLLRRVVGRRAAVGQQTDRACGFHAPAPGVRRVGAERGVGLEGHALRFVRSDGPRLGAGRRGDQDQLPGETGPFERHLERLETADRTADHSAGVRNAEVVR